ncbi:GDSL esterase/lipase At5g55050-like [Juglans microcarpa x Juglans regia]|uniref:GDSL esterase/lipase At5g55050-like n=1 Tax=Juglans microcarpa x Juglans regia TaxID=2249226 RepID=UPI001B7F13B1|nr:GDSL esterase/lipase At5g55050-like [Juglans microcarpa x Juglans regia]
MANSNIVLLLINFHLIFLSSLNFSEAQLAPAVFIFGDSLVDVGNNNYLKNTVVKANFLPHGIDYPGMKPTGRFCNGKNVADFIAERAGLPSSPPYLSLVSRPGKIDNATSLLTGANFASAAAGILNNTGIALYKELIPLATQVDYFATVSEELKQQLGPSAAQKRFAKSVFVIVTGSNDIIYYVPFADPSGKYNTQQQRMDFVLDTLEEQLRRLYDYGARKFVVTGVSALGCCPFLRAWDEGGVCNEVVNSLTVTFNEGIEPMLRKLKSEVKDMSYTYCDSYGILQNLIQNAKLYGFDENKAACCGQGNYRGKLTCMRTSPYCSNRSDYLFWDPFHPTEAGQRILVDNIFDGPSKYTFPLTVRQLIAL